MHTTVPVLVYKYTCSETVGCEALRPPPPHPEPSFHAALRSPLTTHPPHPHSVALPHLDEVLRLDWRTVMVYHSTMNDRPDVTVVCGCGILPLKTTCRGPAPPCPEGEDDIVDEVLNYFKANVLFKQFEVKGSADRVLIYLTLYVTQCLSKLTTCQSKADGVRALTSMAHETFKIPGDADFPLGNFFPSPGNSQEADMCRSYLKQLREEMGRRIISKVYSQDDGAPSKFWLVFSKRKFMNKSLV